MARDLVTNGLDSCSPADRTESRPWPVPEEGMTIDRHVDKTKPRFTQLEKIPWEGEFTIRSDP